MIDIAVGHQLDTFQYLLGNFTSVSATTASFRKEVKVKETGEVLPASGEDHLAFSGFLDTGVFASFHTRAGYTIVGGGRFLWEIQGTEGLIRIVDNPEDPQEFMSVTDPLVHLNGELVSLEAANAVGLVHNVATGWAEFVKGKDGIHATLDDAVKLHVLLDAIRKSASEGIRVDL
jgi:predicted dehydrogenase